jgi:hypothetical protein
MDVYDVDWNDNGIYESTGYDFDGDGTIDAVDFWSDGTIDVVLY